MRVQLQGHSLRDRPLRDLTGSRHRIAASRTDQDARMQLAKCQPVASRRLAESRSGTTTLGWRRRVGLRTEESPIARSASTRLRNNFEADVRGVDWHIKNRSRL